MRKDPSLIPWGMRLLTGKIALWFTWPKGPADPTPFDQPKPTEY